MNKKNPPLGVKLLSILACIGGITVFMVSSSISVIVLPIVSFLGSLGVIIGCLYIAYALGLWNLETWAWWIAMILHALSLVSAINSPSFTVVWDIAVLYYLSIERRLFGIEQSL